jgi:hypothetical protein
MNEIRLFLHELESMDEYSHSIPTGTTTFKMWRRRQYMWGTVGVYTEFVGQYVPDNKYGRPYPANRIGIRWYKVVLRYGPAPRSYFAPDWSNYQRFRKEAEEERRKERCGK